MSRLADELDETFQGMGFARVGTCDWTRISGEIINCVCLQVSGESVCLCLGVHLKFVPPRHSLNSAVDSLPIVYAGCELRSRLASLDMADSWWPNTDSLANLADIREAVHSNAEDFFEIYENFPHPFDTIRPQDLESDSIAGILPGVTNVRRAILIARVADYLGDESRVREWIKTGLNYAGAAVDPRVALRELASKYS